MSKKLVIIIAAAALASVLAACRPESTSTEPAAFEPSHTEVTASTSSTFTPPPPDVPLLARWQEVVESPATEPRPAAKPQTGSGSKRKTYTLRPVTELRSQAAVDRGVLVTWMTNPVCLLAGHDNRGWAWLDSVPTGSYVSVVTGPCTGQYVVYGHRWQSGDKIPGWMSSSDLDLVLQTCASGGLGFTLLRRR